MRRSSTTHFKCGHEITEESKYCWPIGSANYQQNACRKCKSEASKVSQMRKLYGVDSIEERDALLASQGNACGICRRTDCHWGKGFNDTWHIDHDHDRPQTHRGVLCASCNMSLGKLEHLMPQVQAYLAKFVPTPSRASYLFE